MLKFLKNLKEAYQLVKGKTHKKVTSISQLKIGSRIYITTPFTNCLGETYKPDFYTVQELDIGTELDADLQHKSGVKLSPLWMKLSGLIESGYVTF